MRRYFSTMENDKEVWFWMYCRHCKFKNTHESQSPCNECLDNPSNKDSHKPINYIWDEIGEEPKYDSTEERKVWHEPSDQDT